LVSSRSTLFDPQMPADFPERMRKTADFYAVWLGERFDVVYPGIIETEADAHRVADELASQQLDLVVVAPTMAMPPAWLSLPACSAAAPILIWNALTARALGSSLTLGCYQTVANETGIGTT
jgi:hypothetical protein